MNQELQVTVVVENTAQGIGLIAEHGLAYWLEWDGRRILFDTGQGAALKSNLRRMELRPDLLDTVVLSHGHFDHTAGLTDALERDQPVEVMLHPDALGKKFAKNRDGSSVEIGMPFPARKALHKPTVELRMEEGPTRIADGLMTTGKVPLVNDFERPSSRFFMDEECSTPDHLPDDQSIFFEGDEGTVVLLGCAHSGVINTLQYVSELTDERPIQAVMGGMHLVDASQDRIHRTIEELRRFDLKLLAPAHCTGMPATVAMWNAFPEIIAPCHVGSKFGFGRTAPQSCGR
jgi:7,8-dihydropterin-6-yl-methyl-4-(beta-D-ribofuranosyl)aminobenzene 5'-phosphate synthase